MMGNGDRTPSESAPSYDELFADHPVNQQRPAGRSNAYATVPQDEPESNLSSHHTHDEQQQQQIDLEANPPGTDASPLLPIGSKPHVHCDQCERIMERRERHEREKHCCAMVAWTFMMLFVSVMVVGIVAVSKRH